MQFLGIFDVDVDGILRGLWGSLCQLIYKLIAFLYELFMNIASVKLLTNNDIKPIYQRVTLILAIIMVFYVTLEVVKYVVQPDKMTDKEKGASNIVKNMIIVVLLIAFVPTIFEKAYDLQNTLLRNQVFSKMILGRQGNDMGKLGKEFSAQMFGLFYYYDDDFWQSQGKKPDDIKCDGAACATVVQMNISSLATDGTLPYVHMGLNDKTSVSVSEGNKQDVRNITFDGLLAVVVGAFIVYILLMYCIDVGTRVAQLLFLQIIAPIPIIGYLAPKKDGFFQKWVKQCVTTYLDLFLRLAIICFVLLIVEILGNAYHSDTLINNVGNVSRTMIVFMYIAIIMGLLLFAQKAPKMLQELFPKMGAASGNFGLKAGERLKTVGRVAGFGAGAAVGAAAGLGTGIAQGIRRRQAAKDKGRKGFGQAMAAVGGGLVGAARGTTGGLVRGAYNGAKKGNVVKNSLAGAKKQVASNKQFGNRQENGYTFGHQLEDRARGTFGLKSRVQEKEESKKPIEKQMKINNDIFSSYKAVKDEAKKHVVDEGKGRYSAEYKMAAQKVHDLRENGAAQNGYVIGATVNGRRLNTQSDVDDAYSKALAAADNAVDAAEKKAIYDYIQNGEWDGTNYKKDQQVLNLEQELVNKITEYNGTASVGREARTVEFDSATGMITVKGVTRNSNGEFIIDDNKPGTPMTPKDFNDWTKVLTKQNAQELSGEIAAINAEINRIKDETDGSGIGEKKN